MQDQLIQNLKRLVEINSVNPDLSSAGQGEREIAEFVCHHFQNLGIPSAVHTIKNDRCNTTAVLTGENPDNVLLMNGHLDTVGTEGMDNPFVLRKDGDKLFGRGTYDMLGGCAVQMELATYFSRHPCPVTLAFTFVADEENLSMGMEHLVEHFFPTLPVKPMLGIFMEPTEEQIGISHKGFAWFEIEIEGVAAHGSRPEEGVNAIFPLSYVLKELEIINQELSEEKPDPYLGHSSLHPGLISGGTSQSVIASHAKLNWERRVLPGESQGKLDAELQRVISVATNVPGDHQVTGRKIFSRPSNEVEKNTMISELKKISGDKEYSGMSYWADSALSTQSGIPSILFGPAGHGAHAIDEWVSADSLINTYEIIKNFILSLKNK